MLQAVLNQWGFKVTSVSNGRDALDALMDPDGPSLAIMDWMMPEMTGVEVVKKIRSIAGFRPVHLMLLTAKSSGPASAEAFSAGADDHIAKPYNLVDLRARIDFGIRHLGQAATPAKSSAGECEPGLDNQAAADAKFAALLPLNQIAMGVIMVHPEMLLHAQAKDGSCDLDLAVRTALSNGKHLMEGRIDAAWMGSSEEVAVASEIVGQVLLNTLVYLCRRDPADPIRKVKLFSRHDTDDTVLVVRCDGPDLSGQKLEKLIQSPLQPGHGQIGGFDPYFSRLAIESIGGGMSASPDPDGGIVFEFRFPTAI
jgi:CheY-like chemotaxis protein